MAISIAALTDKVRARASNEYASAAKRRNQALAELRARDKETYRARVEKSWDREPTSMPRVTAELRRGLPADAVIVDESITASLDLARCFDYRGLGDYFGGRGGGIGQGFAGAMASAPAIKKNRSGSGAKPALRTSNAAIPTSSVITPA